MTRTEQRLRRELDRLTTALETTTGAVVAIAITCDLRGPQFQSAMRLVQRNTRTLTRTRRNR